MKLNWHWLHMPCEGVMVISDWKSRPIDKTIVKENSYIGKTSTNNQAFVPLKLGWNMWKGTSTCEIQSRPITSGEVVAPNLPPQISPLWSVTTIHELNVQAIMPRHIGVVIDPCLLTRPIKFVTSQHSICDCGIMFWTRMQLNCNAKLEICHTDSTHEVQPNH